VYGGDETGKDVPGRNPAGVWKMSFRVWTSSLAVFMRAGSSGKGMTAVSSLYPGEKSNWSLGEK
jgi:hypothetical protein